MRTQQLRSVLAGINAELSLKHEGWHSPRDSAPISCENASDLRHFALAAAFIDALEVIHSPSVTKVTSRMLAEYYERCNGVATPQTPQISHGIWILACIACGYAGMRPASNEPCGASNLKIDECDWKYLPLQTYK